MTSSARTRRRGSAGGSGLVMPSTPRAGSAEATNLLVLEALVLVAVGELRSLSDHGPLREHGLGVQAVHGGAHLGAQGCDLIEGCEDVLDPRLIGLFVLDAHALLPCAAPSMGGRALFVMTPRKSIPGAL